jgi:fructose-bisphosphate aldolase class II
VPLVLHGSSGADDDTVQAAVREGITKVNVSTHLNGAFTGAVRAWLEEHPDAVDSRRYLGAGRDALAVESARLQRLLAREPS